MYYPTVRKHLSSPYATNALMCEDIEVNGSFKYGSLTSWEFFQKLWDFTLRCGDVYKEQTLDG